MANVLGINTAHAGSSAALVIDGQPVFAIAEERLNRRKNYAGFPKLAILECLKYANLVWADIDIVALGTDPNANKFEKIRYTLKNPLKIPTLFKMKRKKSKLGGLKEVFKEQFNVSDIEIKFKQVNIEHHLAHIASSYYLSGFNEAAGISIDGCGDFVTCMMAVCKDGIINVKKRIYAPHSLGVLYLAICQFIGYDKSGEEGKVMGLAPLGVNAYEDIFSKMVQLNSEGFRLNLDYFMPFGSMEGMSINERGQVSLDRYYSNKFIELFGQPRKRDGEITKRDMDLAYTLQQTFEKVYFHLLEILKKSVPNENLVLSGGCALNSVANGKILDQTSFKNTFIQPASGDDGVALGAALYVSQSILKERKTEKMISSYLGNKYSNLEIEQELIRLNVNYEILTNEELVEIVSEDLTTGNIIGWFQGRMEWGPRALGARSIIAHPGFPKMQNILNTRIKGREPFRPFAPSVLEEYQNKIFEKDQSSPFMLKVYKIKEEWRSELSAVNHEDNTGRIQSVNRDQNPLYYDLIKRFYEKTGLPVILNTSFNENEPIVCTPSQAISCFLRTKMDRLAIGNFYCYPKES